MNLTDLLYNQYVIIIFASIVITVITYFVLRNNNSEEEAEKKNTSKTLLYTFLISFVVLLVLKHGLSYLNNNKIFQKGGDSNMSDRLTVMADDIDIDLNE
jgi:uncharacterized membrane protein